VGRYVTPAEASERRQAGTLMSDITKKIISLIGLLSTAIVGVILRKVFQVWGIFDPFSEWLGGWLKMHITPAQAEWTVAGIISQSRRDIISAAEMEQPESSPQRIGSPLQIEFGNDGKYERIEPIYETGIFRRVLYVSIFNESADDIYDCNIRLIAAMPRPKTGDNPTIPVYFAANFCLRCKQRKFVQILSFTENPGNGSTLERDNIIISIASGGFFPGWTTIPIPPENSHAILTLEAFGLGIASRTAHLHIWVDQRRVHAQII
jgi:hypothetical protein